MLRSFTSWLTLVFHQFVNAFEVGTIFRRIQASAHAEAIDGSAAVHEIAEPILVEVSAAENPCSGQPPFIEDFADFDGMVGKVAAVQPHGFHRYTFLF